MKYPENRLLFTIKEVANTCGISRTTLIRMEECGFLKPYRIDSETGYRYYDADNIAAIGQYQLLQELDISRAEISDLYYNRIDSMDFIRNQKAKIARLSRLIHELESRFDHSKDFTCSYIDLPKTVCYCAEMEGISTEEGETFSYSLYGECVKKGLHMHGSEPLFLLLDTLNGQNSIVSGQNAIADRENPIANAIYNITLCIPVREEPDEANNIRLFPATHAFSMIGFGDYSVMNELIKEFSREIEKRSLKPTGPMRVVSLIAPYAGAHYKTEDYCFECVLPVENEE